MGKPITHTLAKLQQGLFVDTCSDLFAQVLRMVEETGKAGKLTITLDVKKVNALVSILAKVTDKTPEKAPDADMFYLTEDNDLSVENPKQRRLDLRVAETKREVRGEQTPERALRESIDPVSGEVIVAAG
jgi:hypothetical protein